MDEAQNHEWMRIDANREKTKTNRKWTQIYADNTGLLCSSQGSLADFGRCTVIAQKLLAKK
jgi:hypothetical protein